MFVSGHARCWLLPFDWLASEPGVLPADSACMLGCVRRQVLERWAESSRRRPDAEVFGAITCSAVAEPLECYPSIPPPTFVCRPDAEVFVAKTNITVGSVYKKAVYRQYTDARFNQRVRFGLPSCAVCMPGQSQRTATLPSCIARLSLNVL